MHLFAPEVGFMGSVPIVAATVPIAVGAALAAKMDDGDAVAVTYFRDGAAEEGVVHESLNLASQMNLPVIFVCENNLYASHMDIAQRQPSDSTARFAQANGIAHAVIDGNDVAGTARTVGEMITTARQGAAGRDISRPSPIAGAAMSGRMRTSMSASDVRLKKLRHGNAATPLRGLSPQ